MQKPNLNSGQTMVLAEFIRTRTADESPDLFTTARFHGISAN